MVGVMHPHEDAPGTRDWIECSLLTRAPKGSYSVVLSHALWSANDALLIFQQAHKSPNFQVLVDR